MWDDVEEETPAQPETKAEGDAAPAESAPAPEGAEGEANPEVAEPPPPENPTSGSEPRRLVFKHWVRPKFFQYSYLYDYQKNYYDDLIKYLDRRNQGYQVETPRAQTWGERALRTYLSKNPRSSHHLRSSNRDLSLLHHISVGAKFQRYHSKSLISRKYSKLGFNTVSI